MNSVGGPFALSTEGQSTVFKLYVNCKNPCSCKGNCLFRGKSCPARDMGVSEFFHTSLTLFATTLGRWRPLIAVHAASDNSHVTCAKYGYVCKPNRNTISSSEKNRPAEKWQHLQAPGLRSVGRVSCGTRPTDRSPLASTQVFDPEYKGFVADFE